MNSRFLALALSVVFLGAGCSSSVSVSPTPATPMPGPAMTAPTPTPSTGGAAAGGTVGGSAGGTVDAGGYFGTDQRSRVPSDIPLYPQPQGVLMGVTGYGDGVSVSQMTQDSAAQVMDWLKVEFPRHGASLKSSTQEGNVTKIIFESADHRYSTQVEAGAGGTFFTIMRGGNAAILGQ